MVICMFFYPDFNWTWYAIEFDGKYTFFGLVDGFEEELRVLYPIRTAVKQRQIMTTVSCGFFCA